MVQTDRIRVLMAKPGVDGHWRGIITVTKALRDAGMEVVYLGNQTPEEIARVAVEEDVSVVGLSVLAAGHIRLVTETVQALDEHNVDDALLVVGGIIPKVDIPLLKKKGVHEVFGPGTPMETIVDYIQENAPRGSGAGGPAG
jgi:methylmalonyl-CoA mutase C-terminal domain/subunit